MSNKRMRIETVKNPSIIDDDPPEERDLINGLSDDCLAKIFTFIPPMDRLLMKLVCQKWRRASQLSWSDIKQLHFYDYDCWTVSEIGAVLQHCGRYLTELISVRLCESKMIPTIGKHCHNLTKLELNVSLKYIDYNYFLQSFTELKKLNYIKIVDYKRRRQYAYTTRIYTSILQELPEGISEIHFSSLDSVVRSTDGFLAAIRKFNNLRCLTLNNWQLDYPAMLILATLTTLTELDLKMCGIENKGLSLVTCFDNLTHLNIENVHGVDGDSIIMIANTCKKIKYLNISGTNWTIPSNALQKLWKLDKLENLLMNSVNNADNEMFNNMFKLQVLECNDCSGITDEGIKKVVKNCPDLETLNVLGTGVTWESLIFANRETMSRKNDITLTITTDNDTATDFEEKISDEPDKNQSDYLIVDRNYRDCDFLEEFDEDEDFDDNGDESEVSGDDMPFVEVSVEPGELDVDIQIILSTHSIEEDDDDEEFQNNVDSFSY